MNGLRPQDGMFNERDMALALAFQMHEESLCNGCGLPSEVTHGDRNVGRIEFRDDSMCHGCAARSEITSNKNRITYPGQEIYPVDTHNP